MAYQTYNPGVAFFIDFYKLDPSSNNQCIFYTLKRTRCRWPCGDHWQAVTLREAIIAASDEGVSLDLLQRYILSNCCRPSHADHGHRMESSGLLMSLAQRWQVEIRRHAVGRFNPTTSVSTFVPPATSTSSHTTTNYASTRPTSPSLAPQSELHEHVLKPLRRHSVSQKMLDALEEGDFQTGSLYIFDLDSSPGHVKIGWTASSIQERLEQWSENCGCSPNLVLEVDCVPYAQRAEALTHYELIKEWRREKLCPRREKPHLELFEISRERAEQVVGNWAEFMTKAKPYDSEGLLEDRWKKVIEMMDRNGETVTGKKLLDHYEACLVEETTIVEDSVDLDKSSYHQATVDRGEQVMNDSDTIHFDGASIETSSKNEFIQAIAESLFKDSGEPGADSIPSTSLCTDMSDLLAEFALRLRQEKPTLMASVALVFIHKYRHSISGTFEHMVSDSQEVDTADSSSRNEKMTILELMQRWSLDGAEAPIEDSPRQVTDMPETSNLEPEGSSNAPMLQEYESLLRKTSSYDWLIASIQRKLLLTQCDSVVANIRTEVLKHLPTQKEVSKTAPLIPLTASIELVWDAQLEQYLSEFDSLDSLLTITGHAAEAQAVTCLDYVQQMWHANGTFLLRHIDEARSLPTKQSSTSARADGTIISIQRLAASLVISITGTKEIIAEAAEQICWLKAAFQPLPFSDGIVFCSPILRFSGNAQGSAKFAIRLEYSDAQSHSKPGNCWHRLFRRCLIIKGFPVRRRAHEDIGLELSLNMITNLLDSGLIHEFAGKFFIKGFSAILAPAQKTVDTVIWHLSAKSQGERISYLDHGLQELATVDIDFLRKARHIVGWCSKINNQCGFIQNEYNVGRSSFTTMPSSGPLGNANLSFGQVISGGPSFRITPNHEPVNVATTTHLLDMLRFLESKFVLFWDTQDHRGWLVDGLRALLHLLRYSLKLDEEEYGGGLFVLRQKHIQEPAEVHHTNAARVFLSNPHNLAAKVSISDMTDGIKKHERLGDRMKQLFGAIEKAFDYQTKCANWAEIPRSILEGWDFVAFARKEQPIPTSTFMMPSVGRSWVDLTRAIGAITLFGEGFGELLTPMSPECITMPRNEFYLAISVSDMQKLMVLNRCNPRFTPRYICRSPPIVWHSPTGSTGPCKCESANDSTSVHNAVQVMWPQEHMELLSHSSSILDLQNYKEGAIIFGHHTELEYHVADSGPPIAGRPPNALRELEAFEDSGIGSSLSATAKFSRMISATPASSFYDPAAQPISSDQRYRDNHMSGGFSQQGNTYGNVFVSQFFSHQSQGPNLMGSGDAFLNSHQSSYRRSNERLALSPTCVPPTAEEEQDRSPNQPSGRE